MSIGGHVIHATSALEYMEAITVRCPECGISARSAGHPVVMSHSPGCPFGTPLPRCVECGQPRTLVDITPMDSDYPVFTAGDFPPPTWPIGNHKPHVCREA